MKKVLAATLVLTLGVAAFAQDFVMGIVFDAGGKFDGSFNEGTWRGMERALQELEGEYEIEVLEFEGTPDTAGEGQRRIASQGAELIVAPGFAQAGALANTSREFPDTNFVMIDEIVEGDNIRSYTFKDHEGSFLVGYIAGKMSQTGVVGFVGGMDIPLIRNFNTGYEEGVLAACEDCQVISNYVGTTDTAWNDPTRAKELATNQHAQGADIIYHAAGGSGRGVIDFVNETMCYQPRGELRTTPLADVLTEIPRSPEYENRCGPESQPLFFIGVDSNQNFEGNTDNNPETLNHGLTSMMKRVDVAAYEAVMDVVNDEFEAGVFNLGVAEGGVSFALDEYNEALLPESLLQELEDVQQQIIDGEIEVTDYREL